MSKKHICNNECHKCLNCGKKTFTLSQSRRRKKYCDNKCQHSYLKKNGIYLSKSPDFITEELMRKMYLTEKKSVLKIGREIGKSIRQVSRYLKKFNISTRPFSTQGNTGEKSGGWKGGITPINTLIRGSVKYSIWRLGVFERDKFTCVICGQKGGDLQADHIKPFAFFKELRFELSNGRTLCKSCHRKTDTYGNKKHKTQKT